MPNLKFYRKLIQNNIDARTEHQRIWQTEKRKSGNNTQAYQALEEARPALYRQLEKLYETCLTSLRDPFLAGESPAIDEIVTFIEFDLPGFRTGYDKESYLTKLKKLKLSEKQMDRLRAVALKRCASDEYRREDGELRRLMIRLADAEFLNQVSAIPSREKSRVEGHKSACSKRY
jgi:hypothetical protein